MNSTKSLEWFTSLPVERADTLKIEFAFDLEKAIETQLLTRKAIAEKLGTSPAWITKVLRGDANLTIESMAKLAEAVGYTLHFDLRRKAEVPSVLTADVFTFETFRQAKFKGAKEAEFRFPRDFSSLTNESEYADAA